MPYNLTTLENGCRELGIELSQKQKNQFIQFYEFLVEKNKVMNLTGITEFEEVLTKHFLDSLACVKAIDMTKVKTIMDIGTGAGFPGVPLKIAFPHLEACLLDSLATLSEYCLPYVKTGGTFISYKSGTVQEEAEEAEKAINILGGQVKDITYFKLPDSEIDRSLVIINKKKSTPGKYPRKAGTPLKEPLS